MGTQRGNFKKYCGRPPARRPLALTKWRKAWPKQRHAETVGKPMVDMVLGPPTGPAACRGGGRNGGGADRIANDDEGQSGQAANEAYLAGARIKHRAQTGDANQPKRVCDNRHGGTMPTPGRNK